MSLLFRIRFKKTSFKAIAASLLGLFFEKRGIRPLPGLSLKKLQYYPV